MVNIPDTGLSLKNENSSRTGDFFISFLGGQHSKLKSKEKD